MVQTYKPDSIILQKYVDFFYVFSNDRSDNLSYIAFPHVNTGVSFFKGVEIERKNHELTIKSSTENKYVVEILGKYTRPVFVNYIGHCEEIAVIFKPLGVNHFFENNLIELSPLFSQELKNNLWTEFSNALFTSNSVPEKLQVLEAFLLGNLREVDHQKMYNAINYLEDFEENHSIDKIAQLCGFTLKTFQRNFSKHLTCTPIEYKRISRFRYSLQNKLVAKEIKTLTSLSHDTNYYDQSYFIREYKKLTQLNPKGFFDSITALDEKKIVWKLK